MEEEIRLYLNIKKQFFPKNKNIENEYGIFSIGEAFTWDNWIHEFAKSNVAILKGYFKTINPEACYVVEGHLKIDDKHNLILFANECYEIKEISTPVKYVTKENLCLPQLVGNKMWKGCKTNKIRAKEDANLGEPSRQKQLHREYNDLKRQARAEVYAELGIKTYSDMRRVLEGWVEDRYKQKLKEAREKSQNPLQTLDKPVQR